MAVILFGALGVMLFFFCVGAVDTFIRNKIAKPIGRLFKRKNHGFKPL